MRPLNVIEPDPVFDHAFGLEAVLQFMQIDSLGGVTQYAYDPEDRLTKLTAPWGTEYDFDYDGFGRRTSLTSTSGRVSTMGYTNGLLSALSHAQNGVALTDLAYRYDVDGQLIGIDDLLDPSKSKGIAYDDLNRLVQVAEGVPVASGGTQLPIEDYAYDEEGNRTVSHLSVLYASNDHNQLAEDDEFTYAYDEKGNRISKTAKVGGAVETYSYDSQNRLVGYASETTTASYAYDAMERRIAKTVDGAGTAYVYDMSPDDSLAMDDITLEFETGTPSALKRRWAHSNAVDEPVGFEEYNASGPAGSGSERLMYADRQGSILWVTDPVSNDEVAAYEYNGFGQIMQTQGTLVQPYGYTGREYDLETGLYFYRARYFDPVGGVFLQSDPLGFGGGDENLYSYSYENPFNFADPNGLSSTSYTSKTSADDKKRKGVLPNINYGIGSVLGTIGEMLGYVANVPLSQQPPHIRDYHPGAGSGASDLRESDPRCIAAKSRVKNAKARVAALGRACVLAKDYTNVLRMRANMEEGVARTQRDIVCPMDPVDILSKGATRVGELAQKMDAFGHMNRCRAIVSLYGR